MWSSLVWGTGKSVIVAILVIGGTMILGVATGTAAGWFGGLTDTVISRVTDIFLGLPFILGAIVFLAIFPTRNIWTISLVLTIFGWTSLTRVMRGSVIAHQAEGLRRRGQSPGRDRHVHHPQAHPGQQHRAGHRARARSAWASIISAEATLTFLGVGYQRPTVSWGLLVAEGQNLALAGFWHLLVYPVCVHRRHRARVHPAG